MTTDRLNELIKEKEAVIQATATEHEADRRYFESNKQAFNQRMSERQMTVTQTEGMVSILKQLLAEETAKLPPENPPA